MIQNKQKRENKFFLIFFIEVSHEFFESFFLYFLLFFYNTFSVEILSKVQAGLHVVKRFFFLFEDFVIFDVLKIQLENH